MLLKFLGKHRDLALFLLRLGLGAAYIVHGLPKLVGGPSLWHHLGEAMGTLGIHYAATFWGFMAAFSEGIGGVLLVLGAFYRPSCLLLSFTMLVATLQLYSVNPHDFVPLSHPLKMAIVFSGLAFIGPGKYSIDKD